MNKEKKWVHFIGICGVTMAQLAYMFKKKGWFVTGSDKGIFPPMSDYLKDREINIELGFKEEHLKGSYYKKTNKDYTDLVIVGNYASLKNQEYKYAKKKGLNIKSFPEMLKKYVVKSNSIVIAGTYGKTTSTALMALIFDEAGKNPSYMIGGLANNFKNGVKNTKSKWSIIEGDEYTSSRFDLRSKFHHYQAEFLLLIACSWEHTDIFKTEQDYIDNFKELVKSISRNGIIVANRNGKNVKEVIKEAHSKVIIYELNKIDDNLVKADWFNLPHKENEQLGEIVIFNKHTKEEFTVETELIGSHNRENIIGCCVLARELGIDIESIKKAVSKFKGIKRRLEIRYQEGNIRIIDDFACSPPKIIGSMTALNEEFPDWHKTIIFEPNVGNRTKESLELFQGVFKGADEVIIPHLKPVKTVIGEHRVSGEELRDYLNKNEVNVFYIEEDNNLIKHINKKNPGKHIICFMGAYGWRNMIIDLIKLYKNR